MYRFRTFVARTIAAAALTAVVAVLGAGTALAGPGDLSGRGDSSEPLDGGGFVQHEPDHEIGGFKAVVSEDDVLVGTITPEEPASGLRTEGGLVSPGRTSNSPFGAADDFKAAPGCAIQCITAGYAYARGVNAELRVWTDTPATIWIIVYDDDGYNRVYDSGPGETYFAALFDDLEPGKTYQAMAVAEDAQGYASHGYGDFTTLTRNVQLTITHIDIHEAPYGDDDYAFDLWVDGGWVESVDSGLLDADGDTLWTGIQIVTFEDVDRYLDLALLLTQFNESEDLCEADAPHEEPTAGSDECDTWASAFLEDNDLDDRPADATSWTQHSFTRYLVLPGGNALPGGYGAPLDFSVEVAIEVTYE